MLLPLSDRDAIQRVHPRVTVILLLINALVFAFELYLKGQGGSAWYLFLRVFGMTPYAITHFPGLSFLTFITSVFLHSGWLHFLGNMMYLATFGHNVEANLGGLAYLLFYVVCGIVSNLAQFAVDPQSMIPVIGASGAIAGVLGATIIRYPRSKIRALFMVFPVSLPAWLLLGFWFVLQLFSGLGSLGEEISGGGIAYFAHIGGFLAGALLMAIFTLFEDG